VTTAHTSTDDWDRTMVGDGDDVRMRTRPQAARGEDNDNGEAAIGTAGTGVGSMMMTQVAFTGIQRR
jgi:adenylosuccinate synthase